jgi:UDP-GlcNAc:undecaprenyl-phosphate GlcNAc-1-phosphate transferase
VYSPLLLGVITFIFALALTPIVRRASISFGFVDRPDENRKLHKAPIPRVGGVAILLALLCTRGMLYVVARPSIDVTDWSALPIAYRLIPAAAVIFLTGLLDDLVGLRPWQKLIGQTTASLLAYFWGVQIQAVGAGITLHWWSLPITVAWLVLCTNAVNLIDGLDGLATGIGFLATLTIIAAGLIQHNGPLAIAAAPVAGALLGFLRYNFNPASIFLGDCGSLFIGFLLGCYGVLLTQKSPTVLSMAAPLVILSIPLLDVCMAIIRRFLRNKPIFTADRGHIHHRLQDRGLTVRNTALVLYGFCILSAFLSLLIVNYRYELPALAAFSVLAGLGIRSLKYIEFGTVRRMLLTGSFRKLLASHISLEQFASTLARADTPEDCWLLIKKNYQNFGFSNVQMQLAGHCYIESTGRNEETKSWRLEIPISDRDYIQLAGVSGPHSQQSVLPVFAEVLRQTLGSKLSAFHALEASETLGIGDNLTMEVIESKYNPNATAIIKKRITSSQTPAVQALDR